MERGLAPFAFNECSPAMNRDIIQLFFRIVYIIFQEKAKKKQVYCKVSNPVPLSFEPKQDRSELNYCFLEGWTQVPSCEALKNLLQKSSHPPLNIK